MLGCFVGLSLGPWACAENNLSGSLTSYYNVDFDRVQARLYKDSELAIEFVRDNGEVPVRITIKADEAIKAKTYSLPRMGTVSGRSGDSDMPQLTSGSVTLDAFKAKQGETLSGTFTARFDVGKDELNLTGDFSARLELVAAVPGYHIDGYPPEVAGEEDEPEVTP